MLDIIQKSEYFNWLERGVADANHRALKGIQDGWIFALLHQQMGLKIAEVGGGRSRTLSRFSSKNECWNIDKFEGVGQGPTEVFEIANVKIAPVFLGDFSPEISNDYFDVVFSVSVVEHVPNDRLEAFFADCYRILKPGGVMAHAIDIYIGDTPSPRLDVITAYHRWTEKAGFQWVNEPVIDESATFHTYYASNPDMELHNWNQIVPNLKEVRTHCQSASIKLLATKPAAFNGGNPAIAQIIDASKGIFAPARPKVETIQAPTQPTATTQPKIIAQSKAVTEPQKTTHQVSTQPPALVQPRTTATQLAVGVLGRIREYYSRWTVLLAGIALILNTLALVDEMPFREILIASGTIVLLFLIGHAASKADYVLAELEDFKKRSSLPSSGTPKKFKKKKS